MTSPLLTFLRGLPVLSNGSRWPVAADGLHEQFDGGRYHLTIPGDPYSEAIGWVRTREDVAQRLEDVDAPGNAALVRARGAGRAGWVAYVTSHPERRREGRGRRLLDALLRRLWAAGAEELWLESGSDEDGASPREVIDAWYGRRGFAMDPAGEGRPVMRAERRGPPPVRANPGRADRAGACGAPSPGTARRQVPALLHRVPWRRGTLNADLGGGPWPDATRWLARRGVENVVVDPGWQSAARVLAARARVAGGRADTVTLANVLNVVPAAADRRALLALAADALAPGGVAYVGVYEGDRGGVGGATRDGWQANRPLADYAPELRAFFGDVRRVGGRLEGRAPRAVRVPPLVCGVR